MSNITPCLWFDGNAEEAANFYASLFPDSHIDAAHRAPSDYPSGKTGGVLMVEFTLMGQPFTGLNGGPLFQFNEAISFQIPVETQADADRFTNALSAVPEAEQCGWVKDRFGVSWQIVPRQLIRMSHCCIWRDVYSGFMHCLLGLPACHYRRTLRRNDPRFKVGQASNNPTR